MADLAGQNKPPRARSGQQQWQRENWASGVNVEKAVLQAWEAETGVSIPAGVIDAEGGGTDSEIDQVSTERPSYPPIDFISAFGISWFKRLPTEEQAFWKAEAKEESRLRKEAYEEQLVSSLENRDAVSRAEYVLDSICFTDTEFLPVGVCETPPDLSVGLIGVSS